MKRVETNPNLFFEKTKVLGALAFTLLASLFLSSCGNIGGTGHPNYLGNDNSFSVSFEEENPDYACPSSENIRPKFDYWLDGTFFFTVCRHKHDLTKIVVHGRTASSDMLRVYPAFYQDSNHIYALEDMKEPGMILSQTTQVAEAGAFFDFADRLPPDTTFNALFVIEDQDKDQMDRCLAAHDYFYCPMFAYGKFR